MPFELAVDSGYWWLAPKKDEADPTGKALALAVRQVAENRATMDIPRRFKNLTFRRHYTGRPYLGSYAFGLARSPSNFVSHYGDSEFTPPRFNLIGTAGGVYKTRALIHKSFVEFTPEDGDFDQRQMSEDIVMEVERGFTILDYWHVRKMAGVNAQWSGSGFVKWAESFDGKPECTAPDPDELLFANYDDPSPNEYLQYQWVTREDALDRYGKSKDGTANEEARKAILNAQAAYPAFFFGPGSLATANIIPLIYGLRASHADGSPGREVLVVGDYTIFDREWKDADLNLDKYDHEEIPGSLWGQGLSELLLGLNVEIDESMATEHESFLRSAGKWFYDAASDINPDALGDQIAAAIAVAPGAKYPQYVTPDPVTKRNPERVDRLIKFGMQRAHISETQVQGEVPKSLTSAVALESFQKIDDINFADHIERLEKLDLRSAFQLVRLNKKLSYSFAVNERDKVDYAKLKLENGQVAGLTMFNTGRLGQTYSGKEQTLATLLQTGSVKLDTYNKYLEVPDNMRMLREQNAPQTGADAALDRLVVSDDYIPPTPFLNLDYAKQAAENKFTIESNRPEARRLPQKQLDQILMWRAAVMSMIKQRNTPDQPAANAPAQAESTPAAGFSPTPLPASVPGAPQGPQGAVPGKPIPLPSPAQ